MGSDWGVLSVDMQRNAGTRVTVILNVYRSPPLRPTGVLVGGVAIGVK
jgi:hypothetical protein